jgi:phosphate transport system protein
MNQVEHIAKIFDADMASLRRGVVEMARLAEAQFRRAVQAVMTQDWGLSAQVLGDERQLNALDVELDALCNRIIALRQPAAVDLREVIGALHTIGDLERIGDEAKKIALKGRQFDPALIEPQRERIHAMAEHAARMVGQAIDALVAHDTRVALELGASDDTVDDLRDELVAELSLKIAQAPQQVAQVLTAILIVQSIERVADHAENVAEYIVNVVEGIDMRHGNLPA